MQKLFSVIIPVLNEKLYIADCLNALRNQSFPRENYELIFVDNGSADGSYEFLREQPDIVLLREDIPDAYIARNRGIGIARGRYIVFTDADCLADSEWLAALARKTEGHSPGILLGRLSFPGDAAASVRYYEAYYASRMRMLVNELPRKCCFGHAGNMAVRSDLFSFLGLFSGMPVVGDTDIVQKFLAAFPDENVAYADDAVVTHLEVVSLRDLLHKLYRYGKYSEDLRRLQNFQISDYSGKIRTFARCVRENGYRLPQSIFLMSSLLMQQAAFLAGRYRAKMQLKNLRASGFGRNFLAAML